MSFQKSLQQRISKEAFHYQSLFQNETSTQVQF